jgi:peptide methionine sulfoxide reductase MsrB
MLIRCELRVLAHTQVLLQAGTERSGTGVTVNGFSGATKEEGTWVSAVSGVPLFPSSTKVPPQQYTKLIHTWHTC